MYSVHKCVQTDCANNSTPFNPLPSNDSYMCCETFSLMMSYPAMSLRDRFCMSGRGGTGGGGWVHPKGANYMAISIPIGWSQAGHFSCFKHK